MKLSYVHLRPGDTPPAIAPRPHRAVLIAELATSQCWQNDIASWLVQSECLYFIAWGIDCEVWHDTVDWTVLERFDFGDIPDDRFVMTTWHDKELLPEALWFAGNAASHPDIDLVETVIVHVAPADRREVMLQLYEDSQVLVD